MIEFEWSGVRFSLADCGGGILKETIPMHCHSQNSYELHFVLSGQGTLLTDSGAYKMRAGNFFVTGPGVPHAQVPDLEDPVKDLYIYIQKRTRKNATARQNCFWKRIFSIIRNLKITARRRSLRNLKASTPAGNTLPPGL